LLSLLSLVSYLPASRAESPGEVRIPLPEFQELVARAAVQQPVIPPPVGVTLSQAEVRVEVQSSAQAEVRMALTLHVLSEDWVSVPLLPAGLAVQSALEDDKPVALEVRGGALSWAVRGSGLRRLELVFSLPVQASGRGLSVALPLPAAAAQTFQASLPGEGLEVAVVPAAGLTTSAADGRTRVTAAVPRAPGVQLVWGAPGGAQALVVGAEYEGELRGQVVAWQARLQLQLFEPGALSHPVLSASAALASARVDGREAVVEERDGQLRVQLSGAGRHRVELAFETPVDVQGGPPGTTLWLPRPPVSRFRLNLPGRKELAVEPRAGVEHQRRAERTQADFHLPPADQVRLTWSELPPEAREEQLQAHGEVFHVVHAEEGVLHVEAILLTQVNRGAARSLSVLLPGGVAVNQVLGDGVADWRVTRAEGGQQRLTVYLDREQRGEYRWQVHYERALGPRQIAEREALELPLLRPEGLQRQRGMVALLQGADLSMQPEAVEGMSKVGENQLPAWVREGIQRTVAHTLKYVDPQASLQVRLAPPERKQGKFDAVVDTLLSVGDGVLKASASVQIAIKSGRLMELDLELPPEVNLVSVTAPSLRDYKLAEGPTRQLQLTFTQEMEGNLAVELAYERVLSGSEPRVAVPLVHATGADMEQGRLAVEALSAVEVQAVEAGQAQPLDAQELPRQLLLRTTNPVLLAFKYVHSEPPLAMGLEIKHHEEMKVQVAAIDQARYQSLLTRHGLMLTRAQYQIRNRRKQFLRVDLPAGSELWSARMNGEPVKPARGDVPTAVLVPLTNSERAFEVELVYASAVGRLGLAGWAEGGLPVPDIVETRSTWDVYLPADLAYGAVDSNMTRVEAPAGALDQGLDARALLASKADALAGERLVTADGAQAAGALPLALELPEQGVRYRFEKLFANKGDEPGHFSVRYATAGASTAGEASAGLVVLLLAGLSWARARGLRLGRRTLMGAAGGGLALVLAAEIALGASWLWLPALIALPALAALAARRLGRRPALPSQPAPAVP